MGGDGIPLCGGREADQDEGVVMVDMEGLQTDICSCCDHFAGQMKLLLYGLSCTATCKMGWVVRSGRSLLLGAVKTNCCVGHLPIYNLHECSLESQTSHSSADLACHSPEEVRRVVSTQRSD